MPSRDYYEVLNIDRSATQEDIKQAYKKLALKWHPDKNRENPVAAEEMFKLVAEAYATLSDPKKRRAYDRSDCDDADTFGYSGDREREHPPHGRRFADDVFNQFFQDFGSSMGMGAGSRSLFNDPFFSDPFSNDPFFSGRKHMDPFGFGTNSFGSGNRNGFSTSSSSMRMSFGGSDGDSRSVGHSTSTTTTIDADGTRRTRTVTTTRHSDGRVEKKEENSVTDSKGRNLLQSEPSCSRSIKSGEDSDASSARLGAPLRSTGSRRDRDRDRDWERR